MKKFNGLINDLGSLTLLSDAESRSISPENYTGEKGKGGMAKIGEGTASYAARDLGQTWKVNPFHNIASKETFVLADIDAVISTSLEGVEPAVNFIFPPVA